MIPNKDLITIHDNIARIQSLLQELVLFPRIKALEWSQITKQTPNMKIGYPGQHLASLITGIEGSRTGARGDDLLDGTEVKACSRVDQLDTCSSCGSKVLRIETVCPHCDSDKIKRMDDSKWLFSIKSKEELQQLTVYIDRIFLTIADYPNFISNDFNTIRFQAFEIWTKTERHKHFSTLMSNYYNKIFLEHIKRNPNKTPAPKNFWPFSYQFYLCNPVKVFNCIVYNANTDPDIQIDFYFQPTGDRGLLEPEKMPSALLNQKEILTIIEKAPKDLIVRQMNDGYSLSDLFSIIYSNRLNSDALFQVMPYLDESVKDFLDLRDTDIASEAKVAYTRNKKKTS